MLTPEAISKKIGLDESWRDAPTGQSTYMGDKHVLQIRSEAPFWLDLKSWMNRVDNLSSLALTRFDIFQLHPDGKIETEGELKERLSSLMSTGSLARATKGQKTLILSERIDNREHPHPYASRPIEEEVFFDELINTLDTVEKLIVTLESAPTPGLHMLRASKSISRSSLDLHPSIIEKILEARGVEESVIRSLPKAISPRYVPGHGDLSFKNMVLDINLDWRATDWQMAGMVPRGVDLAKYFAWAGAFLSKDRLREWLSISFPLSARVGFTEEEWHSLLTLQIAKEWAFFIGDSPDKKGREGIHSLFKKLQRINWI